MRIQDLTNPQKIELIAERKKSAETLWSTIDQIYTKNTKLYGGEPDWVASLPATLPKVSLQRAFTNMEAVINSVLANPPKPNVLPAQASEDASKVAHGIEKMFVQSYKDRNVKETLRKAFRDLYFCRLLVIKPFWNAGLDDIDAKRVDPRKVRFATSANNTDESPWFFEEVESTVWDVLTKYGRTPEKKADILKLSGMTEAEAFIKNPKAIYDECWYGDYLMVSYKNTILWEGRNPYFDYDGVLVTKTEFNELLGDKNPSKRYLDIKRATEKEEPVEGGEMSELSLTNEVPTQEKRKAEMKTYSDAKAENPDASAPYESYLLNHFDRPRMPYIVASIFKNEDGPIGRTSFLEMAGPLCQLADERKVDIVKNARNVNGVLKVDKETGISQKDASKIMFQTGGLIYGKGVTTGVQRETGQPLPQFVQLDLQETLNEIDNIMAATSAFRGEREGQETKAGRMALIEQSFLRLNELVQTVDYVSQELFNWWFQLAITRYTNTHYVKDLGEDGALEVTELSQENLQKGTQITVIPGKTLPEDRQFRYERAQEDAAQGRISNLKYLEEAGYEDPRGVAKEAFLFQTDPNKVLGVEEEAPQEVPPEMVPEELPQEQMIG